MDKPNIDKVKLESSNIADENFEKLASLFPNVVTEIIIDGKLQRAVDKDKLMQEINAYVLEGIEERYNFSWPDKRKSVVLANAPTRNTLRACKEESKDFDRTENLYIEGDNLEVLKLLRNTYMGKVKMIYIDPPYNTGKDFVYQDNFYINRQDYLENSGQFDEEGNRLFENTEANGRFHTDWLNMMYPRLKMARDLLTDDGVIFISIDDNEVHNLRKICDEIFGKGNFVFQVSRLTSSQRPSQEKTISITHDYILCYGKSVNITFSHVIKRNIKNVKSDNIGLYIEGDTSPILASSTQGYSKSGDYDFDFNGKIYKPEDSNGNRRRWLWNKERMEVAAQLGILVETKTTLRVRNYIDMEFETVTNTMVKKDTNLIMCSSDFMSKDFTNDKGSKVLSELICKFDFPKPIDLIKIIVQLATAPDSIILDFFSGSSTTAHAVMQLNAEDGGNRKYIMVQLPEKTPEDSEAKKAGYSTICEIGKERIRRAGEKIKKDYPDANIDTGFRVFKLDSSNMEDVYYEAEKISQQDIRKTISNIKADRSNEDLLFQIILLYGIPLKCKIEIKKVNNRDVYFVDNKYLLVCFEKDIDEKTIEELAKLKPEIMVFNQDTQDSTLANIEQIFKMISSDTNIRVI